MQTNRPDIATLYFRNKHLLFLTIAILLIAGMATLANLPRLEDPRITTRNATILTFWPGASPRRIEALINQKIEERLEEIHEIKIIESTAKPNVSSIAIELLPSVNQKNNENIFAKIRSRLQNLAGKLPVNATVPFLEDNRAVSAYTLIVALSWYGELDEKGELPLNLLNRVALDFKDKIRGTANTEFVRLFGQVNEEITVTPNKDELAALNMSVAELSKIIASADSKISAGQFRGIGNNLQIEIDGSFSSVDRILRIPIKADSNGVVLTLGDIAKVEKSYQNPPHQMGFKDGKRTIYIGVRADENVRVDKWTQQALEVFNEFRAEYAKQIGMEVIFKQNDYTASRLSELLTNLFLGAGIVVLVVLFAMGWKSALVVGSVLPLSGAGVLFGFNFFNQSIHQMSIFGMLIAIGLLIDCAIVMTDEVRKSIKDKGMEAAQAIRHAVRHLFAPLLASTFTTILGFMPIFLLPGNAGDFVSPIAISVVLALCFSFFLSMTVIPSLASSTLKTSKDTQTNLHSSWWHNGLRKPEVFDDFKNFTRHALTKPKRYALVAMALPITGFLSVGSMKVEFFPAADRDMFEVQLFLPTDSSIDYTKSQVEIADSEIKEFSGVRQVHWLIGASTPAVYYNQIPWQDSNNAFAQAVVVCEDVKTANNLVAKIQAALDARLANTRPLVLKFAQGPPATAPVAFRILGPDLDILRELGEQLRAIMHKNVSVTHTRASIEGGQAKLWFQADEAKVNRAGLNLVNVAQQFQSSLEGFIGGSVLESVEELPVRVRLNQNERSEMASVSNLLLSNAVGSSWIPADSLGDLVLKPEIGEITRYNGQRVNTVLAYIKPEAKAVSVSNEILAKIKDSLNITSPYSISVAGESEQQGDALAGLSIFAPVLGTLMIASLILAFRSLALAGIVFIVAVLSVGLGMLSLKIAGYPLGFNPMIGSIGLAGVAINGAIVVLAAIVANEKAKTGDSDAIVDETYGCGRHMLSTTLTTIGGFVPLLIFSSGTFWPPLAVIIAGGMGFSLLLTMFFTPLAYKIYADTQKISQ